MSSINNQEEDRGFVEKLNAGYIFCTVWISIFFILTTVVYYYLLKSSPFKNGQNETKIKKHKTLKSSKSKFSYISDAFKKLTSKTEDKTTQKSVKTSTNYKITTTQNNGVTNVNEKPTLQVMDMDHEEVPSTSINNYDSTISPVQSPKIGFNSPKHTLTLTPKSSIRNNLESPPINGSVKDSTPELQSKMSDLSINFSISASNTVNTSNTANTPNTSNVQQKKVQKKVGVKTKVSKGAKISWRLGLVASTFFLLRVIFNELVWIFWDIQLRYDSNSGSFISDCLMFFSNIFNGFFLYLFFIYRLYNVYNSTNSKSINMNYNINIYIVLIILNIIYMISLTLTLFSWALFLPKLYVASQIIALIVEVFMTSIIFILFSKPLLNMSINQRRNTNTIKDKKSDKLITISTKLLVLSVFALGMTLVVRIFVIASYSYCPDECWLTYPTYNTWSTDAFVNIFCILCTFKNGEKYYSKYCQWLHNYVLLKCIGRIIDKHVKNSIELTTKRVTSVWD